MADLSPRAPDFDAAPFTIAWELTRACAYSCSHCRADAQPHRDPGELDTGDALELVDRLTRFRNRPILVLTGGDPLMRKDVFEIASHASERGLRVALTPTATGLSTPQRMRDARAAGVRTVAFSLDAPEAGAHDSFRRVRGSFARTLRGITAARDAGLPLQINTTACALNEEAIEQMPELVAELGAMRWAVFFLVPVGRGRSIEPLSAERQEHLIHRLLDLAPSLPFDLKFTAAPQHRRIEIQRAAETAERSRAAKPHSSNPRVDHAMRGQLGGSANQVGLPLPNPRLFHAIGGKVGGSAGGRPRSPTAVNDGRGFMFISHRGEVMPSGFLPLSAGRIDSECPVEIYRESALMRRLRDREQLKGKCGACEFSRVCGGSRARAYAATGDPLQSDPGCPYLPPAALPSEARQSRDRPPPSESRPR